MKQVFKILLYIGVLVFVAGLIFLVTMFFAARKYRDKINSTVHVFIELKEDITDLKTVELRICDEINSFTIQSIKDTVSENIGVSYKEFPCKTSFRYIFSDGTFKEIPTADFNCAGCSGTHVYMLSGDTVTYTYMP